MPRRAEFRTTQNWIGAPGSTLANATYVPPPPDEMHECLKHWERFINQRDVMPDLVQCAIMHEHFEAIHPFIDGNGRIGRLLITVIPDRAADASASHYCIFPATSSSIALSIMNCYSVFGTDGDWTHCCNTF